MHAWAVREQRQNVTEACCLSGSVRPVSESNRAHTPNAHTLHTKPKQHIKTLILNCGGSSEVTSELVSFSRDLEATGYLFTQPAEMHTHVHACVHEDSWGYRQTVHPAVCVCVGGDKFKVQNQLERLGAQQGSVHRTDRTFCPGCQTLTLKVPKPKPFCSLCTAPASLKSSLPASARRACAMHTHGTSSQHPTAPQHVVKKLKGLSS